MKPNPLAIDTIFCFVLTLAVTCSSCPCQAQAINSKYNLRKVSIKLMDGRVIHGTLTNITRDSLALQTKGVLLPERNRIEPGMVIEVHFRASDKTATCDVREVTPEWLVLTKHGESEGFRCAWSDLEILAIKKFGSGDGRLNQIHQRWFPATSIRHIALHKKGSGGVGAIVGLGVGALLGYTIGLASSSQSGGFLSKEVAAAGTAVFFGIIAMPLGAAVGSSNKKMMIEGDQEKLAVAREEIVRR